MNRPSEPSMNDPADNELHRPEGVDPYPTPRKPIDAATQAQDDEATSTPANNFERGLDKDGNYRDAADEMKKTLKDDGDLEDWRKGRTQGAPERKH